LVEESEARIQYHPGSQQNILVYWWTFFCFFLVYELIWQSTSYLVVVSGIFGLLNFPNSCPYFSNQ